jgi:hypothetical protein
LYTRNIRQAKRSENQSTVSSVMEKIFGIYKPRIWIDRADAPEAISGTIRKK